MSVIKMLPPPSCHTPASLSVWGVPAVPAQTPVAVDRECSGRSQGPTEDRKGQEPEELCAGHKSGWLSSACQSQNTSREGKLMSLGRKADVGTTGAVVHLV